jgi:hypothetical protein
MAEQRSDDLLQARRESAELIGLDVEHLSPADTLRCDMISALRIVIDSEQANVVDGGRADLGRLVVATEQLIKLLPERQLAAPESQRDDPRRVMFEIYKQMRERGELSLKALPPEGGHQHRIDELEAENERLKAQLAGGLAPVPPDVPMVVERMPAPVGGNVVPLPRSNPPAASAAPQSSAAPQYDYDRERGWRDHVLPDGTITPTPMSRGRWWGPV